MRETKFRLVCRDAVGLIFCRYKTLDELLYGKYNIEYDGLIQEIIAKNQFIGLYDRNGKEIYEDDILKTRDLLNDGVPYWEVLWDQKGACFVFKQLGGTGQIFSAEDFDANLGFNDSENIGSIYENPSLLGDEGE